MEQLIARPVRFNANEAAVEGWLWCPPTVSGGIVACHGGLDGASERFRAWCHTLALSGCEVLAFNFPGESPSAGPLDPGGSHVDAVVAAHHFLASQPEMSGRRIALVGNSVGGLEALLASPRLGSAVPIALFAAMVSLEQVYSIFLSRQDPHLADLLANLPGPPETAPAAWAARSALQTDIQGGSFLFLHGLEDTTADPAQVWELTKRLTRNGAAVDVCMFAGEGHNLYVSASARGRLANDVLLRWLGEQWGKGGE